MNVLTRLKALYRSRHTIACDELYITLDSLRLDRRLG